MKLYFQPLPVLAGVALSLSFLASCTKENVQSTPISNNTPASNNSRFMNTDEVALTEDSGYQKLVLRPGPKNGQDVYVDRWGSTGSGNQNYVPELPVNSWDYAGGVTTRSYIKFDSLRRIPATAQVVSARLYLYAAENFLNHPQGNTGDNRCLVQRVISRNWKESNVTWKNQPAATTENQAIIPASDEATQQFNYNPVVDVTALVQEMVAHPETNYGLKLSLLNEHPNAAVNFASSEAQSVTSRPRLIVYYR